MRSSAIFLVSVVTSVRWPRSTRVRISFIRSSIWLRVGRTSTSGSTSPVGRTSCSTTWVDTDISHSPGVADTKTTCGTLLDELVEPQRPVVEGRGQAEAVLDEHDLAAAVALVHAVQLGDGDVRLVDEHQEVVGEEVEQRVRRLAGLATGQDARVVLDAVAVAQLAQHLHVVLRALAQAEGLELLALCLQFGHPASRVPRRSPHQRPFDGVVGGDEVGGRVDGHVGQAGHDLLGERVDLDDLLDPGRPTG